MNAKGSRRKKPLLLLIFISFFSFSQWLLWIFHFERKKKRNYEILGGGLEVGNKKEILFPSTPTSIPFKSWQYRRYYTYFENLIAFCPSKIILRNFKASFEQKYASIWNFFCIEKILITRIQSLSWGTKAEFQIAILKNTNGSLFDGNMWKFHFTFQAEIFAKNFRGNGDPKSPVLNLAENFWWKFWVLSGREAWKLWKFRNNFALLYHEFYSFGKL